MTKRRAREQQQRGRAIGLLDRKIRESYTNVMKYFVYIMSNKPRGTLYVGVTNDLIRRIYQHKSGLIEGFTKKYELKNLVYYEGSGDILCAIQREKTIKKWRRYWKVSLIEKSNPRWEDLYANFW